MEQKEAVPQVIASVKYIKQDDSSDATISLQLDTKARKFEISGKIEGEDTYDCQGYKLSTHVKSPSGHLYDIQSSLCSPGFIKIVTGSKSDPNERYAIKLGLESYTHAEVSVVRDNRATSGRIWKLVTGEETQHVEEAVVAVSVKLTEPTSLTMRGQFDDRNLQEAVVSLS